MAKTDNSLTKPEEFTVDVGEADVFLGDSFERPWFYDTRTWKMMRDCKPEYVHIKTWKGEVYQFMLYKFHNKPAMLITSTLRDTFIVIKCAGLSIEGTMAYARQAKMKKTPVNGSYTGYWTWGGYFEDQYARLKRNMDKQNIYFSDEALKIIYDELVRRQNAKKHTGTGT